MKRLALLLACLSGLTGGCTLITANRVFPKPAFYWSAEAKAERQERAKLKAEGE